MKTLNEENFTVTNTCAGRVTSEYKIIKKRLVFNIADKEDYDSFNRIKQSNKLLTHPDAIKDTLKILGIAKESLVDLIVRGIDYGVAGNRIEQTYAIMPIDEANQTVIVEYFDRQLV